MMGKFWRLYTYCTSHYGWRCTKVNQRAHLAASFHKTIAIAVCETAADLMERYKISDAAISGCVFQNRKLVELIYRAWHVGNLYMNEAVPANDGGLALRPIMAGGQA